MLRWYHLFLILVLVGCEKDISPTKKASLQIISGDKQTANIGDKLEKPLRMKVKIVDENLWVTGFSVVAKFTKGNGFVSSSLWESEGAFFTSDGEFSLDWSLGCDVLNQEVTFYLYHISSCGVDASRKKTCQKMDSVTFTAAAYAKQGWSKSCGINNIDTNNGSISIYNNTVYLLNHQHLYKAVIGETLSWEPVEAQPVYPFYHYGFDSKGWLYFPGNIRGFTIYKGVGNVENVNTGLEDAYYGIAVLVEDSVIFSSYIDGGIYRLRPNDVSWTQLKINGVNANECRRLLRHPNGDLYTIDKWGTYFVSSNSGDTWKSLGPMYNYVDYKTQDFKIHPTTGILYIGSGGGTLAVIDPGSYVGENHIIDETLGTIDNIQFKGNEVYYLSKYYGNKIYSSASGWQRFDSGFDKKVNWFGFDLEGKLLICGDDGIYYYKD